MKIKFWEVMILGLLFNACGQKGDLVGDVESKLGNIVGGTRTTIDQYPFMVQVGKGCGGSLIHERWVLTAAHCVPIAKTVYSATNWKSNLSWYQNKDEEEIKLEGVYYHARYNPYTMENDIALIRLGENFMEKSRQSQIINLASPADLEKGILASGNLVTSIGWGATREGERSYVSYLNKVDLPIVSRESANQTESYGGKILEGMVVAGFSEGGKDSCQGDSGGPLVIWDQEKKHFIQVGITSWGHGCARAKKYGVYTSVAHYYPWVEKVLQGFGDKLGH